MERSVAGRVGCSLPGLDVPEQPMPSAGLLREELRLPEVTEPEVVRYFTLLSQLNFSVDTHFYPLGSCTMKYNPKVGEAVASLPGFAQLHPRQPDATTQGALELMHRLQTSLADITGMTGVSLAPMAGAHGELAGTLMVRAYHHSRGEAHRKKVLVPDSAHGTNPASAAMGGFHVVAIPSDRQGNMDLEALRKEATADLAGMMFTLPNTLGLFDPNVAEICDIVHQAGGMVYCDGANMNALLGRVKLGELGFDVAHLNLHKTFSTPHGGGGPGAGPVCAGPTLSPFLPSPVVLKEGSRHKLGRPPKSIGKLGGFHGNFGVLVRALAYISLLGGQGMREISLNAVINANYLLSRLKDVYHLPYDRRCMHEVVLCARNQRAVGVKGLDVAKRLLDYGFHAPTMYFPLIVEEALMVEPTETESRETLDAFIQALREIDREARENPDLVRGAPHSTPISRLDEATAARHPDLRWRAQEQ
ncbi:MAG: aminomethyl-transferring glycine dehydrogenase subunit GcvPB [Chloroflexi bacterium]|nr:aminomethyl-transferring glycine dehydrogenase subunit GcvPB [Chloroflexota bacterium]